MGVESKSFKELIELLNNECGAKYSCLAYADFLRNKALAEGNLQPNPADCDYKFLMQLLSYNQTESKLHEEIGLVSFKDGENYQALLSLELQLQKYKQNTKKPKEEEISKYETAIDDLKKKISDRIAKLDEALKLTTDPLLLARFNDYLASNTEREKKILHQKEALICYSATAGALRKCILKGEFNNDDTLGQAVYDMAAVAKRSSSVAYELARQQGGTLDLIFTDKFTIKVQIEFLFFVCNKKQFFFGIDLVDFLLEYLKKKNISVNEETSEDSVNTALTAVNLLKCCEIFLHNAIFRLGGSLLEKMEEWEKGSKRDAAHEVQQILYYLVEMVHRMWIISIQLHQDGSHDFTQTNSVLHNLLFLVQVSWKKYENQTCSNTEPAYLLGQMLTDCIYGITVCKRQETKNASPMSASKRKKLQKITKTFSELGKKCINKLNNLDKEQSKRKEQFKDFVSVGKAEETVVPEIKPSASDYKKLFLLATEILLPEKVFLNAGLRTRRFQERYFDQEIENLHSKIETKKVKLELEASKGSVNLLDPVELFKKLQNHVVERIITKVSQKVFGSFGSSAREKEEVLKQLVASSKFVPLDRKLNVTSIVILGLNAKTGSDWLVIARSAVAELEYCLRYWRGKHGSLHDGFKNTEELLHILGQKNVFYLQLLLCNKTTIVKQLFDYRNKFAHGDISDFQAHDEQHNFKFIWHLFFHIVCEFIPEEGPNN